MSKPSTSIYTPLGLDGYELCHPVSQYGFERINVEVKGTPVGASWRPISMRIIHEDEGQKLAPSDSPWLGSHALIFRTSAVEALAPMLRKHGELLPLRCAKANVVLYNPTCVLDALDESASSVLRFGDGRIMMIQRHVFRADVVGNIGIFKIPNLRVSPIFVSHRFVQQWKASGLKGLKFKQVWAPSN